MTTADTLEQTSAGEKPLAPLPASILSPRFAALGAAVLTGGLLWMCHFPLAWGWLAWIALVPLLALVRSPISGRWRFLAAYLGGLVFFVPVLQWMRVADPAMYATWIALALYCALFLPVGVVLVRRLDQRTRLPLVLTVPLVWTALDYFRGHFLGGFGWYFLGHTQHIFLPIAQVADLGGVYVVTFLVAAVNAVLFEWLCRLPGFRRLLSLPEPAGRRLALPLQTVAVLVLVGASLGYGCWRLSQNQFTPGPRVALLQGNTPQSVRNTASGPNGEDAATMMLREYQRLCDVAARQQPRPDLIVWPETCFPAFWYEVSPQLPQEEVPALWVKRAVENEELASVVARDWPTNVLLGMNSRVLEADGKVHLYNSAVLVRADGSSGGRYDKMHLVPFGEYLPLRDWVPGMKLLSPYDFDYSVTPGRQQTRFALGDYHFGVVICYEDSDLDLARHYVRPGAPPVDFLVNTSNDGWFWGTSEHEEHLVVARFRAIECRRPLLRAVNMGISAVIDSNGHVLDAHTVERYQAGGVVLPVWEAAGEGRTAPELPLSRWAEFKKVPGVLLATVPLDRRGSCYAAWGDWLPWSCWAALVVGLLLPFFLGRKQRDRTVGTVLG